MILTLSLLFILLKIVRKQKKYHKIKINDGV